MTLGTYGLDVVRKISILLVVSGVGQCSKLRRAENVLGLKAFQALWLHCTWSDYGKPE